MRLVSRTVRRFQPRQPWANRILYVDLSDMSAHSEPAEAYVPYLLGSRGLAARLCWDRCPAPIEPEHPDNPFMVVPGALTGSRAPYSGRTTIHAFSPQAWPYRWFTRSSIGGHFGGELKRAGYDALVVTGTASSPVRIRIVDDQVSILPADDLWGLGTMDALEALQALEGQGIRSLVVGPAGERLSRIGTVHTASSSAAGQGGFGAVMGAKRLKAISVVGTGHVSLAHPERITALARALAQGGPNGGSLCRDLNALNSQIAEGGDGHARRIPCTEGCVTPCQAYLEEIPGVVHKRRWSGAWHCIAGVLEGFGEPGSALRRTYDYGLERHAAYEANFLMNRYGLNQYDLLMGMAPWLIACQKAGLISAINGQDMDWYSPHFWSHLLHAIAYRQGLGDALAEGGWAAAHTLHLGEDLARVRYPAWGHPGHWDGRDGPFAFYPYWLVSALQWLADTRDPFDSGHGYTVVAGIARWALQVGQEPERTALLQKARALGARIYGDPDALDPLGGYRAKAHPAFFHTVRPVIKDCLPVDDLVFPLIADPGAPDGFRLLRQVEGIGDIPGPSVEYHLWAAGTGLDWPEEEFTQAAERVVTLERALQVRHWGRDRVLDESVLPYFEQPEMAANPLLGERQALDRARFGPLVTEFYALHGWDANGQPTRERLEELGLAEMYQPMLQGAGHGPVQGKPDSMHCPTEAGLDATDPPPAGSLLLC